MRMPKINSMQSHLSLLSFWWWFGFGWWFRWRRLACCSCLSRGRRSLRCWCLFRRRCNFHRRSEIRKWFQFQMLKPVWEKACFCIEKKWPSTYVESTKRLLIVFSLYLRRKNDIRKKERENDYSHVHCLFPKHFNVFLLFFVVGGITIRNWWPVRRTGGRAPFLWGPRTVLYQMRQCGGLGFFSGEVWQIFKVKLRVFAFESYNPTQVTTS